MHIRALESHSVSKNTIHGKIIISPLRTLVLTLPCIKIEQK